MHTLVCRYTRDKLGVDTRICGYTHNGLGVDTLVRGCTYDKLGGDTLLLTCVWIHPGLGFRCDGLGFRWISRTCVHSGVVWGGFG